MSTLKKLHEVENKSAAQQQAIASIVAQLNDEVPGLALAYDEVEDSLNYSTDALSGFIEKSFEQENCIAQTDRLTQAYSDREEAVYNLEVAEALLAETTANASERTGSFTGVNTAAEAQIAICEATVNQYKNQISALDLEISELDASTRAFSNAQAEAAQKVQAMEIGRAHV